MKWGNAIGVHNLAVSETVKQNVDRGAISGDVATDDFVTLQASNCKVANDRSGVARYSQREALCNRRTTERCTSIVIIFISTLSSGSYIFCSDA